MISSIHFETSCNPCYNGKVVHQGSWCGFDPYGCNPCYNGKVVHHCEGETQHHFVVIPVIMERWSTQKTVMTRAEKVVIPVIMERWSTLIAVEHPNGML